jgi:hypothetical protein
MNEIQIAIEATKEAIKDLVLFANSYLAEQVDLVTEEEIRPYMSSETLGGDTDHILGEDEINGET